MPPQCCDQRLWECSAWLYRLLPETSDTRRTTLYRENKRQYRGEMSKSCSVLWTKYLNQEANLRLKVPYWTHGISLSIVASSGGLLMASSPMYSNRKPNSFWNREKSSYSNQNSLKLTTGTEITHLLKEYRANSTLYLQFELIADSQTGMVAFLSPGHNEALIVWGVAMEQICQVAVGFWSYEGKKDGQQIKQVQVTSIFLFKNQI